MRYALLTGVGRPGQVGEAVAARLAADGYSLVLVDRDAAAVESRAAELRSQGKAAKGYSADLSSEPEVGELFSAIRRDHGDRLAALVHLAGGFAVTGPVAETALVDWERQLTINLRTAFLVARGAIPMLRPDRGSAVFFSSESALPGAKLARTSAYAVAKSGLLTLALAISQEELQNGVRANVLAPAAIRTASNTADMGPDARFVEREDVAATVSWLCSAEARAVTGQVIRMAPRS
jgi:NAD(P)-dependent dehydrogenase (short-subunit alcohol dehydrogenase family)